ncbi:hypothetical protein FRC17_007029 [Serendipita sp. 399]|nr:hypothetical protein FRC17_007029 [Serendipita sp. 399]
MSSFFGNIKAKYDARKAEKKAKRESKILSKDALKDATKQSTETGGAPAVAAASKPEGDVHILPVPGNTNEPPQVGGGLNTNPEWELHRGAGPVIPTSEQVANLEQPLSREELRARAEALNA